MHKSRVLFYATILRGTYSLSTTYLMHSVNARTHGKALLLPCTPQRRKQLWKNMDGVFMNPVIQKPQKENLNGSGRLTGLPQDCLAAAVAWSYLCLCRTCLWNVSAHKAELSHLHFFPKEEYSLHQRLRNWTFEHRKKSSQVMWKIWDFFPFWYSIFQGKGSLLERGSSLPLTDRHIRKLSPFVLTEVMVRLGTDLQTAFSFNCFLNQEQLKH